MSPRKGVQSNLDDFAESVAGSDAQNRDTDGDNLIDGFYYNQFIEGEWEREREAPTFIEQVEPYITGISAKKEYMEAYFDFSITDVGGIKEVKIYCDDDCVQTWTFDEYTPTFSRDDHHEDIPGSAIYDTKNYDIKVTDNQGNVIRKRLGSTSNLGTVVKDFLALLGEKIAQLVVWIATVIPYIGAALGALIAGATQALKEATVGLVEMFSNLGSIRKGFSSMGEQIRNGNLGELASAIADGFDSIQRAANPFDDGSDLGNTFKTAWYTAFIATTVVLTMLTGAAASAAATKFTALANKLSNSASAFARTVGGAMNTLKNTGVKIYQGMKASIYKQIAVAAGAFSTAFIAAELWPEMFAEFFDRGFGYVATIGIVAMAIAPGPDGARFLANLDQFADDVARLARTARTKFGQNFDLASEAALRCTDDWGSRGRLGLAKTIEREGIGSQIVDDLGTLKNVKGVSELAEDAGFDNLGRIYEARVAVQKGAHLLPDSELGKNFPGTFNGRNVQVDLYMLENGRSIGYEMKGWDWISKPSAEISQELGDKISRYNRLLENGLDEYRFVFRNDPPAQWQTWLSERGVTWEVV